MKKIINLGILLFLLFLSKDGHATHMIGGDIAYRCLGNNKFEITLTLYQDCLNGEPQAILEDNPAFYNIYTRGSNPSLVRSGEATYISKTILDPNFSNECINNSPNTCLQREVFKFTETLLPSSTGYYIVYQRCCRNAAINNIVNPGNTGVTYMAEIPPFSSGQCPNNSAIFKNFPPQIICVNNPFSYDFSALDSDGDSLTYELCAAHPGGSATNPKPAGSAVPPPPYPSVVYVPPYSATSPVLGFPPLSIDLHTGLMTGTPTSIGRFVVTVCVKEWRNGELLNTVSRDVQFVITNCSKAVIAEIPELPDFPNTYAIQCKGYTVTFKNNSTGGFSYSWDFGVPGATSTAFEPTYTFPDTGTYNVKLVVNPGSTCPDSIVRQVRIYPEFKANYTWKGKLCPGEEIQFIDSTFASFPPITSWHWDFGDGQTSSLQNPIHIFELPGGEKNVRLISKSQYGCTDTITKKFPMSFFDLSAGNDTIIVKGYPFSLNGSGAEFYKWSPPDYLSSTIIPKPKTSFPGVGIYTYYLEGGTTNGCTGLDTVNIQVVDKGTIFVPNAFSPNQDGLNDWLQVVTIGYSSIRSFEIFNRLGQRVFYATNTNKPKWDGNFQGEACEAGVYFWKLKAMDAFGKTVVEKGDVTLIK